MRTGKSKARIYTSPFNGSKPVDFAKETFYRHAIVLRGTATDIDFKRCSFTLKRPDSSHFVVWSAQTEFLGVTLSELAEVEIFVRGQPMNGRLLADSIASSR